MRGTKERFHITALGSGLVALACLTAGAILQAQSTVAPQTALAPKDIDALKHLTAQPLLLPDGRVLTLSTRDVTLSESGRSTPGRVIPLPQTRTGATAVVLADGRVLVWGGADLDGRLLTEGEWFDPATSRFTPASSTGLVPGAGQSLTVLSNGDVLVTGGWNPADHSVEQASLWHPKTGSSAAMPTPFSPRYFQSTALRSDGSVILWGGVGQDYSPIQDTQSFDPATHLFERKTDPKPDPQQLTVVASQPQANAANVDAGTVVSLRFSMPVEPRTVSAATVSLIGPAGPVEAKVVNVQDGRLAFITPEEDLLPGSHYTVALAGVQSAKGGRLPFTSFGFTTAALSVPTNGGDSSTNATSTATAGKSPVAGTAPNGMTASGAGVTPPAASVALYRSTGVDSQGMAVTSRACLQVKSKGLRLCRDKSYFDDGAWYPGQNNAGAPDGGHWRINAPDMQPSDIVAAVMARRHGFAGKSRQTGDSPTLSGQIRLVDGHPIAHVQVTLAGASAFTDAKGNFLLSGVPAGHQSVFVDGTTANDNSHQYGQFAVGVDVLPSGDTKLPYRMYLPRILDRDEIELPSPTTHDMVITHPDMPGLEVRIPAGTVIRDHKGKIVTKFAIVPMPVDRAPFPAVANFPVYFSLQPGGATVQSVDPKAPAGLSIVYPNYLHAAPGQSADFFAYQPDEGWRVYGKGHVTADGQQIEPEAGVHLTWTMGGSFTLNNSHPGDDNPPKPDGPCCGDPVDLFSGTLVEDQSDVHIDDVIPIDVSRAWHGLATFAVKNAQDTDAKMFGSWRSNFDIYLYSSNGDYTQPSVRLPDGSLLAFSKIATRTGDAYTWRYQGTPSHWSGATLEAVSYSLRCGETKPECYLLTLRDGTQYQFYNLAPAMLTAIRDRFGNQLTLTWNAGLLQQVTSPSGRYITFAYNADNNVQSITDHTGRIWSYGYHRLAFPGGGFSSNAALRAGSAGTARNVTSAAAPASLYMYLLDKVTYPDNTSLGFTYEEDLSLPTNGTPPTKLPGVLLTMVDRNGHTAVTNVYDPTNPVWVKKQTFADGSAFQFNFAAAANTRDVTDPLGVVRRIVLDPVSGYPASVTQGYGTPLAQTTTYTREASGLVDSETDALNRKTTYVYDGNGYPLTITRLAGTSGAIKRSFTWTDDGLPTSQTDELAHITRYGYMDGCLTSITNPLGQKTTITCDGQGHPVKVADPLGHATSMSYIGNDLRTVTDALGRVTTFAVDPLGRVTSIRDPLGNTVQRSYDVNNRIHTSTDAMGKVTSQVYDNEGHIKTVTLPNTGTISYQYTPRYWVSQRTDALNQSELWTYDGAGNVATYIDRKKQKTTYAPRDALGRFSKVTYADGSTLTANTYDAGNRLLKFTDSAGGAITRSYDLLDRMTGESSSQGALTYTYGANGLRKTMTPASQAVVNYGYDNANLLKSIVQGSESVAFGYDAAKRRISLTLPNGIAATYGYDNANQLLSIGYKTAAKAAVGDLAYTYDSTGRRNSQTGSFASEQLPAPTTQAGQFDLNNRQTAFNGQALTYDVNGNLTGDGTSTYVWNARNQLVQIKQGSTVTASFSYDALGRRQSKTVNGTTTAFLYDGVNPVQETIGSTVNPILTGLSVDERFARNEGAARNYFLTDALGSTMALTNASGGVTQTYQYDPYGNVSTTGGATNPYQYTGRENDGTGLYYYRARYYSPAVGRFTGEDPIGFGGRQANFYAYVGNDPLSRIDPYGLWSVTITGINGIGGAITFGRDNGEWFGGGRIGIGIEDGISFDPMGKRPGKADTPSCHGTTVGTYIEAGITVGPWTWNPVQGSAGVDPATGNDYSEGPEPAQTSTMNPSPKWGFDIGGSVGGEVIGH